MLPPQKMTKDKTPQKQRQPKQQARKKKPGNSVPTQNVGNRVVSQLAGAIRSAAGVMNPQSIVVTKAVRPLIVSGRDYLGQVTLDSSVGIGGLIYEKLIDPVLFRKTHIQTLMRAYAMYRITNGTFHITSMASQVSGGGYVAGVTPDSTETLPGGEDLLRYATTLPGSTTAAFSTREVNVQLPRDNNTMVKRYTDASVNTDLGAYGQFFIAATAPPQFLQGVTALTLSISFSWTVELTVPKADSNGTTGTILPAGSLCTYNGLSQGGFTWFLAIKAASDPVWNRVWDQSRYPDIYSMNPPMEGFVIHAPDGTNDPDNQEPTAEATHFRVSNTDGLHGIVFFASYSDAVEAGSLQNTNFSIKCLGSPVNEFHTIHSVRIVDVTHPDVRP